MHRRHLEAAAEVGATVVRGAPRLDDRSRGRATPRGRGPRTLLRRAAAAAGRDGRRVVVENMPGDRLSHFTDPGDLDLQGLGLILDVGHASDQRLPRRMARPSRGRRCVTCTCTTTTVPGTGTTRTCRSAPAWWTSPPCWRRRAPPAPPWCSSTTPRRTCSPASRTCGGSASSSLGRLWAPGLRPLPERQIQAPRSSISSSLMSRRRVDTVPASFFITVYAASGSRSMISSASSAGITSTVESSAALASAM